MVSLSNHEVRAWDILWSSPLSVVGDGKRRTAHTDAPHSWHLLAPGFRRGSPAGRRRSQTLRLPTMSSGFTSASNSSAVSRPSSIADCLRVEPFLWAFLAILAALS